MAIRKSIKLNWSGTDYKIIITMGVIDKIDDEINLVTLVSQYESGDIRLTKVARLIAILLNEGGADVEVDDVFHALFGSGDFEQSQVGDMLTGIFSAIFPEPKKKPITRSTKKKTKKK